MAATQIANSIVADTTANSSDFSISTATILLACSKGEVRLQVNLGAAPADGWVDIAQLRADNWAQPARVTAGQSLLITRPFAGGTYRLVPQGKSIGSAYELS